MYVWAAVSAGYPALLFLLIYSMLHHVLLQYWNCWATKMMMIMMCTCAHP